MPRTFSKNQFKIWICIGIKLNLNPCMYCSPALPFKHSFSFLRIRLNNKILTTKCLHFRCNDEAVAPGVDLLDLMRLLRSPRSLLVWLLRSLRILWLRRLLDLLGSRLTDVLLNMSQPGQNKYKA